MKRASCCVMAIAAAVLVGGHARAETEAEYLHPGAPRKSTPLPPPPRLVRPAPATPQPVPPRPRTASPPIFAPAAAASSKRMSEQQREEWRFLKEASAAGRFETEAARLALAKSNNAGIRSLAGTLINHHTTVSNELVHMLHVRGMAPPMLANDQRKTLNRLAKLHGKKFDREFMEDVGLKSQQENVQLYERARMAIGEPQLKAWIERMLPTLRSHLSTAERLASPESKPLRMDAAALSKP